MMEKLLMESSFSKHRNPVSHKELYSPAWMFWKIYKNKSSSGGPNQPQPTRQLDGEEGAGQAKKTIHPILALLVGENH